MFSAVWLALLNVVIPLAILRLVAGRRTWRVRTLMALPVAVAVPLYAFQELDRSLPPEVATFPVPTRLVVIAGTIAGLPILALAIVVVRSLVRLRWRPLAAVALATLISTAAIAAVSIRYDGRSMPAIEHYGRSGWPLVFLPGVYAAGVLVLIGWALRFSYRWLRRERS